MIRVHDAEYFLSREVAERLAARFATNSVARQIHLNLAQRYAEKAHSLKAAAQAEFEQGDYEPR